MEQRAKLLKLLATSDLVRLSSHGCGSQTKLAYRIDHGGYHSVYGRDGRKLAGSPVPDDLLLQHASDVVADLQTFIGDKHD